MTIQSWALFEATQNEGSAAMIVMEDDELCEFDAFEPHQLDLIDSPIAFSSPAVVLCERKDTVDEWPETAMAWGMAEQDDVTIRAAVATTSTALPVRARSPSVPHDSISRALVPGLGLLACGLLGVAQSLATVTLVHNILLLPLCAILLGFTIVGALNSRVLLADRYISRPDTYRRAIICALGLPATGLVGLAQHISGIVVIHDIILVPFGLLALGFTVVALLRLAVQND